MKPTILLALIATTSAIALPKNDPDEDYDDLREEQADMEAGFVEEGAEVSEMAALEAKIQEQVAAIAKTHAEIERVKALLGGMEEDEDASFAEEDGASLVEAHSGKGPIYSSPFPGVSYGRAGSNYTHPVPESIAKSKCDRGLTRATKVVWDQAGTDPGVCSKREMCKMLVMLDSFNTQMLLKECKTKNIDKTNCEEKALYYSAYKMKFSLRMQDRGDTPGTTEHSEGIKKNPGCGMGAHLKFLQDGPLVKKHNAWVPGAGTGDAAIWAKRFGWKTPKAGTSDNGGRGYKGINKFQFSFSQDQSACGKIINSKPKRGSQESYRKSQLRMAWTNYWCADAWNFAFKGGDYHCEIQRSSGGQAGKTKYGMLMEGCMKMPDQTLEEFINDIDDGDAGKDEDLDEDPDDFSTVMEDEGDDGDEDFE